VVSAAERSEAAGVLIARFDDYITDSIMWTRTITDAKGRTTSVLTSQIAPDPLQSLHNPGKEFRSVRLDFERTLDRNLQAAKYVIKAVEQHISPYQVNGMWTAHREDVTRMGYLCLPTEKTVRRHWMTTYYDDTLGAWQFVPGGYEDYLEAQDDQAAYPVSAKEAEAAFKFAETEREQGINDLPVGLTEMKKFLGLLPLASVVAPQE